MDVIFSCCLYGNNSRYIEPLFNNDLCEIESYLGVSCGFHVYCNSDVSEETKEKLDEHGYEIITVDFEKIGMGAMFVRYLPVLNNASDVVCVRDSDCCYSVMELDLIKAWLNTAYDFHIIRGHKLHVYPIMGGLFSIRGELKEKFAEVYRENRGLTESSFYNKDQEFLAKCIYPVMANNSLVHTVRLAFSKENFIHYANSSTEVGFIGETVLSDEKRKKERSISEENSELILIPQWVSKYSVNKLVARVLTLICNR